MIGIHRTKQKENGFTLVEMLVAVSVFAIVSTILTFTFTNYLGDYKLLKAQQSLVSSERYILDMIAKEAKEKSITSSSATSITFSDGIIYEFRDNSVYRDGDSLNGDDCQIDNLVFYYSGAGHPWLTVIIEASKTYWQGRETSLNLQTTVSSRLYE